MGNKFFIGTDIISVPRIAGILERHPDRFPRHSYTFAEIEYCNSMPQPAIHYAGRFAAKEAIKKALLSSKIVPNIALNRIEILRADDGEPLVNVSGLTAKDWDCKVSISHTEEFATAFALVIHCPE